MSVTKVFEKENEEQNLILPKNRAFLNELDTKADNQIGSLGGIEDPKYSGKLKTGASDLTHIKITTANVYLERFFNTDFSKLSFEELMFMIQDADLIAKQLAEDETKRHRQAHHDSFIQKRAEAVHAFCNWKDVLQAVVKGSMPIAALPAAHLANYASNWIPVQQGALFSNFLRAKMQDMTPNQTKMFFESLQGVDSYVTAMKGQEVHRAKSAQDAAQMVLQSAREDHSKIDQDMARSIETARQLLQQKLQAAQTATRQGG